MRYLVVRPAESSTSSDLPYTYNSAAASSRHFQRKMWGGADLQHREQSDRVVSYEVVRPRISPPDFRPLSRLHPHTPSQRLRKPWGSRLDARSSAGTPGRAATRAALTDCPRGPRSRIVRYTPRMTPPHTLTPWIPPWAWGRTPLAHIRRSNPRLPGPTPLANRAAAPVRRCARKGQTRVT